MPLKAEPPDRNSQTPRPSDCFCSRIAGARFVQNGLLRHGGHGGALAQGGNHGGHLPGFGLHPAAQPVLDDAARPGGQEHIAHILLGFVRRRRRTSPAAWALRFVMRLPGVAVVLSGMSDMRQTEENLRTADLDTGLSEEELAGLAKISRLLRQKIAVPCTGCRYCCDNCPQGLDIPAYMREMAALLG